MTFLLFNFFNTWRCTIFNKLQGIILIQIIWLIWLINFPFNWLRIFAIDIWFHLRLHWNESLLATIYCIGLYFLDNVLCIYHLNINTTVILFIQLFWRRLNSFVQSCFNRQLEFILLIGLVIIAAFVSKVYVLSRFLWAL